MKQVNLTVPFEERKLSALNLYMKKKGVELETELQDALNRLYAKYVPTQVREYIDDIVGQTSETIPSRRALKPSVRENEKANTEVEDGQP